MSAISSLVGTACGQRSTPPSGCPGCRSRTGARAAPGTPPGAVSARRRGEPLDGLDLGAVDLRGEQQARADGDAVEADRAAPQTPCSQPTCVPVRPSRWRRKSERSSRGSTCSRRPAVDGDVDRDHGGAVSARADGPLDEDAVSCFRYAAEAWIGAPPARRCRRLPPPPRIVARSDLEQRRAVDDGADRHAAARAVRTMSAPPSRARSRPRVARTPRTRSPSPGDAAGQMRLDDELVGLE